MIKPYEPKLAPGQVIRVDGWVMLKGVEAGLYRIKSVSDIHGNRVYDITRKRGDRIIARHYVTSVDPWVRDNPDDPDLNKITRV
jgi:hypothetical protein